MRGANASRRSRAAVVALVLAAAAAPLGAQGGDRQATVRGTVVEASTGRPVEGALVLATAGRDTVRRVTGRTGAIVLPAPAERWSLTVRRLGFAPAARAVTRTDSGFVVRLAAAPARLADVRIAAAPAPVRRCLDFVNDADAESEALALAEQFARGVAFLEEFRTETRVRDRVDTLFANGRYTEGAESVHGLDSVFVRYERGGVLSGNARALLIALPSVGNFSEDAFVATHCWRRAEVGADSVATDDSTVVIALSPVTSTLVPDVRGRVARDRVTGLPRWLELQVTRADPLAHGVLDVRALMTFGRPVPFLALPETIRVTVQPRTARVERWTLLRRFEYSEAALDAMFGTAP